MAVAKIDTCPEREKYIAIVMDEMHIKADLVYDKYTGEFVFILILHSHYFNVLHRFPDGLYQLRRYQYPSPTV